VVIEVDLRISAISDAFDSAPKAETRREDGFQFVNLPG
jgi:hypothetical protein